MRYGLFAYYNVIIDGARIPKKYEAIAIQAIRNKTEIIDNKMFVRADLMPHIIEITDIKAERLQDISDEDCLREGIYRDEENGVVIGWPFGVPFFYTFTGAISKESGKQLLWTTRKEAFSELINSINGRDTWERNEWQFAYTFKLIK